MDLKRAAIKAPIMAFRLVEADVHPLWLHLEVLGKAARDGGRNRRILGLGDYTYAVEVDKTAEISRCSKRHICFTNPRHAIAHRLSGFFSQNLAHI
eukprot:XP_001707312.1 Hypothetical protein GL50803_97093 [Giardia lamblia ATCC 50803]